MEIIVWTLYTFFRFHQHHHHHHAATTYTQILYLIILCLLLVLCCRAVCVCVCVKNSQQLYYMYAPFCLVIRKRGSSIIVIIIVIRARLCSVALSCSGPFTFYGNVLNLCLWIWIYLNGSFVLKSFFVASSFEQYETKLHPHPRTHPHNQKRN